MARYASGKKSKAISDISGFKVRYTSLKTTYDGLRVEPEEFDPKHPQLTPAKNVFDATALFQPRPDNAEENVKLFLGFTQDIFASKIENSQKGIGVKGSGNIEFLPRSSFNFGADSGECVGTSAIGTTLINLELEETAAVGTGAIGTAIITAKITEAGVNGTSAIGTVVINFGIANAGVSGTGAIGVEIAKASITEAGVSGTGAIGDATNVRAIYSTFGQGTWGEDTWGN